MTSALHGVGMTLSESRRHDLYNGLTQILGPDLTDTLMAYLPHTPGAALAARDDTDGLWTAIHEVKEEIRHLSDRIDRLQHILVVGFMSLIVVLIVVGFFG